MTQPNNHSAVATSGFYDTRFGRVRRGQSLTGLTDDALRDLSGRGLVKAAPVALPAAGAPPAGPVDKGAAVMNKAAMPVSNKAPAAGPGGPVAPPKAPAKG